MQTIEDKPNTLLKVVGSVALFLALLYIFEIGFLRLLLFVVLTVLGVLVVVYIATVVISFRFPTMRYSKEGDAAFLRLAEEIRADLKEETTILEVEGRWMRHYPKLTIVFASDDAIREAQSIGLLERVAKKVEERVKHDPAFGRRRNRESFDPQQGIEAVTTSWRRMERVIPPEL